MCFLSWCAGEVRIPSTGPTWMGSNYRGLTRQFPYQGMSLPNESKQVLLLSWGKHLVILGSFFGHFWGHFLDHFLVTFWTTFGCHFGADGPGVIFTAGLGVIFTAGLGVIFTAGLGVISTAGLGVIFTAGLI